MLVAYVSGHGFGHATRTAEVLRAVRERDPDLPISVVSSAPAALFREALGESFAFRSLACDVGLAQKDALTIDEAQTVAAWRAFAAGHEQRRAVEAAWIRKSGARLVLADIPALAFDAASAAGVPAVGLANFSWDWIYRHYAERQPALAQAAEVQARSYGNADLLLELPFAGDLSAFPRREAIPLVARRPRVSRAEARSLLGLPDGPLVLLSFGGLGLPGLDLERLASSAGFRLVTAGEWLGAAAGVLSVEPARLAASGLGYQELVAAVDVVVTKPGYGIVSDAIAAGTRLVYTERGDFPEYPILVEALHRYLPAVHVSNGDLIAGRFGAAVETVLARPRLAVPDLRGAAVAAERLLARLSGAA